MNKDYFLIIVFIFFSPFIFSQELKGIVLEIVENKETPIVGANIYWIDNSGGTISDIDGKFKLANPEKKSSYVVSYVGYQNDTIKIESLNAKIILKSNAELDAVNIKYNSKSSSVSLLSSANIINISSEELLKAACCNLAESFETTPSIDVNFSDAISGRKQINMLGLSSPNILISIENIPSIRGSLQSYGLTYIPGTWIESMQIAKGSGSVVNGYESVSGQINVELRKPLTDDKFFLNLFADAMERLELNAHYKSSLNNKFDHGLYFHTNRKDTSADNNNDGFRDNPTGKQLNILNRFQYTNLEKGLVGFFDFNYVFDERTYGENEYIEQYSFLFPENENYWGGKSDSEILKTNFKIGYVDPLITYRSLGFQFAYTGIDMGSSFGNKNHDTKQTSIYSNLVYNSIIGDIRSKIKTGISLTYDEYDEFIFNNSLSLNNFDIARTERSIGAYFEYNYDDLDKINLSAGLRLDNHNKIGNFISPRFHMKYRAFPKSTIKLSFGKATRVANIFSENQKLFYSSREIIFTENSNLTDFSTMKAEQAWNYGLSIINSFKLFNRESQLILDYYITDFQNKVVVDWETPSQINFYNLTGKSYSNSFQAQLTYTLSNSVDLLFAYKNTVAETDYISHGRLKNPLTPSDRLFFNLSYNGITNEKGRSWKYDFTFNHVGEQRIPSTQDNPEQYRLPILSDRLNLIHTQITRIFSESFQLYLGVDNLTNYKQQNAIISSDDPFGDYFDATYVYGPIFGRNTYVGLRYYIK
ncbi:MAG: TonB-dependent receptor [Flavobacteriaceae bacterium]|nr:TonB-dependent receptor [Flavobacteriaceae bacterium]